jgi:hypothetical protein
LALPLVLSLPDQVPQQRRTHRAVLMPMFPAPQSRPLGQPTHPLFIDAVLLSPTQDRSMAGTSLPQNPLPWQGVFKPCSALKRHIRHRHHPRQMRQLHPVLRSQKPPVRLLRVTPCLQVTHDSLHCSVTRTL